MKEKKEKLINYLKRENFIPLEMYKKYDVKRGLRDIHGKGVLVGLTKISEVHGYLIDESEKIPDQGRLLYRGLDIFDIVNGFQKDKRFGFEETIYLLLFGILPSLKELNWLRGYLVEKYFFDKNFIKEYIFKNLSFNIMNFLQRSVLNLYDIDKNSEITTLENILFQSLDLISKIPILISYGYLALKQNSLDDIISYKPKKEYSIAENILYIIRKNKKFTFKEAEVLDLSLVLHSEHGGGNNSSFTNYVISSSGTDIYSATAASIGSLKGPKHGGANKKVLEMVKFIINSIGINPTEKKLYDCIFSIIKKESFDKSGLIYGMGHAIYTLSDPRALLFKEKAKELAAEKGVMEKYNLLNNIEKISTKIFKEIKGKNFSICSNIDFYSGFIYEMLEIPEELFTPIFAASRIVGWCAHRLEQAANDQKIIRPAYKYIFANNKKVYFPISKR